MWKYFLFGILFIVLEDNSIAQTSVEPRIHAKPGVKVLNESKQNYKFPWAGGLNSCQFGEIDLNLDGVKDLFVFERYGNRILTFINNGTPETIDYSFAPAYIDVFPEMHDWAILRDYNNDGLEDIFTYSFDYPGIIVYKNNSQNELKFELEVYPYLTSLQGSGQVNILVTSVDYPGIEDIDNDGDLDILTFWGLGSFVEYHQNQSMELYGIPDSLEFIEITQCWGQFAENEESNILYLDTCNFKDNDAIIKNERHTGSSFLLIDLDADNDKDLLLGDVDYPNLVQLINGGTPEDAYMISQDNSFPSYNTAIDIFSMPVAAYIDINNDETKDLLVSAFDPNPYTVENYNSVWAYLNSGENNLPELSLLKENFLQEDMIDVGSGAYPFFVDFNNDGLKDLFISNYGLYMWSYYTSGMLLKSVYYSKIALFENTGTVEQPEFTRLTHNFSKLDTMHLTGIFPAFADLDGDNDTDMLFGQGNGSLTFQENIAESGAYPEFNLPEYNYAGVDVGKYSTPQLFDLNGDGLLDLIIGEQAGNLNYYENTGTVNDPEFTFISDSLGKINVTDYNVSYDGYSTPCFFPVDDQIELIVGSEQGQLFYFKDIKDNLDGAFTENDSLFLRVGEDVQTINHGKRTSSAISQIANNANYQLIVGNFSGGVNYYAQSAQPPASGMNTMNKKTISVFIYPNPVSKKLKVKISCFQTIQRSTLKIYNANGVCVLTENDLYVDDMVFDFEKYLPGIYFYQVQLTDAAHSYTGSFIKVN
jgi:hypothetical protein